MAPPKPVKKPVKFEKPVEKAIDKSKKLKKKSYKSFSLFIYKILRSMTENQNMGISKKTMMVINNCIMDMLEKIASEAGKLVMHSKKTTLSSREIQSAVNLILPKELASHATSEAMKAISLYHRSLET